MNIEARPTRVLGFDSDGLLVFAEDKLVAVLVRLSELHGEAAGQWFFEAGFGDFSTQQNPTFPDVQSAQDWISDRLTK